MSTNTSPASRRAMASWRWWDVSFGLRPMTTPLALARSLPSLVRLRPFGQLVVPAQAGTSIAGGHERCRRRSRRGHRATSLPPSGAKSDRKQLARVTERLGKGDVLVVTRLDRLARSTRNLLNVLGGIADKGAGFKSLRDTWADTTTPHGRLMLTVLGGLAEFERELIFRRQLLLDRCF
jgi:hypothetical protein